jgi:anthranilate synthase component I
MYTPDFENFKRLANKGNLIPVYREFVADMETPVSAFKKIDNSEFGFLLESVEGGEKIARYSFLGSNPDIIFRSRGKEITLVRKGKEERYTVDGNPLDELEKLMKQYQLVEVDGLPRFLGGAVGYISYDAIQYIEDVPQQNPDDLDMPELYFMITDTILIFDHIKHTIKVVSNAHVDIDPQSAYARATAKIDRLVDMLAGPLKFSAVERPGAITDDQIEVRSNFEKEEYKDAVEKCKEYIRAGDIFQVVISQRFEVDCQSKPLNVYRSLRSVNPSPYMYYLKFGDKYIVGSSPEILVRCEDGVVEVRPIAGTRPRGADEEEDKRLADDLLADPKECAEHIMLVDLGRNDVGRVCDYGSVHAPELMVIEKYSHVMHIVSDVVGKLNEGLTPYAAFKASFPAGTVSGAPKIRAMEIIEELEKSRRGPYAGSVGYFSFSGNLDTAITIRTIVIADGKCYVQAGAGIVADSVPETEYEETRSKARGMLRAIKLSESF